MRKSLDLTSDVVTAKVSLNEYIDHNTPLMSGSGVKRTYNQSSYFHMSGGIGYTGWYTTIYNASYLLSSSYALYDITYGFRSGSAAYSQATGTLSQRAEKERIYKLFANKLMGSATSSIVVNGVTYDDMFFITAKRQIFHDLIRPGSVIVRSSSTTPYMTSYASLSDSIGGSSVVNLFGGSANPLNGYVLGVWQDRGFVCYDAGIVAVTPAFFELTAAEWGGANIITASFSSTIDTLCSGAFAHLSGVAYQNTTQLHSAIYFCELKANEFNYSTNPTYVDASGQIVVTKGKSVGVVRDAETYVSGVNLYDDNGNLIAVAKSSFPLKKNRTQAITYRVRLDY